MPSILEITPDRLAKLIGTPNAPTIIDVRIDEDFAADPPPRAGLHQARFPDCNGLG